MPLHFALNALRLGSVLAVTCAAAGSAAANEDVQLPVQLRYASPAAALVTQVHLPLGTQRYYVGNYTLQTESPAISFIAYCVDPFIAAQSSYLPYTKSTLASYLAGSAQKLADVGSLFSHAYAGSVGNATQAAGFQLALWEVFNDNKNLATGQIFKTSGTDTAALAAANAMLVSLSAASWATPAANYELTMYSNDQAQSYLAATPALTASIALAPLPEPEVAVVLLLGLGLLGLASYRRGRHAPS